MSIARQLMLLLPTAIFWLGLDQWSKQWAADHMAGHPPTTYGGILTLVYSQNLGAWGSLGASWPQPLRWMLLSLMPALLLAGLAYQILRQPGKTRWDVLACALLLAGGLGNLIDRFRLGYVRDFLHLGYGPLGTNIFNVADMVLMVGLGILLAGHTRNR
ncbi:signal peptidase II [bacterium]|nr:signal peptidase II [bacterium]